MVHPFEEPRHNKLETLNLLNLVLINALKGILMSSDLQLFTSVNLHNQSIASLALYIMLILFPALVFICYYMGYRLLKKVYIKMKAQRKGYQQMDDSMQFEREE